MNKFDRILSILVLLQTKSILKASSIAERYNVSLRTVYRDMNSLKKAGIPIIGDPGIGYSIMDGYRMPPVMFSESEATAFLTAEKIIGKLTDQNTEAQYASVMLKIKAVLRRGDRQSLATLDDSIVISGIQHWETPTFLQEAFKSIAAKQLVNISYQKIDGTASERTIEPVGCYHHRTKWYLVAFCQTRQDYRTFILNRISSFKNLHQHFQTTHISLKEYIEQQDADWKTQQPFIAFEIAFNLPYVHFADMRKHYFGFTEQKTKGDVIHMKFLNTSIEFMARWLIQFGKEAKVIAPDALKERMRDLAEELHQHHCEN